MLQWINSKRAEGLCVQSNLIMEKAESIYLDFNEDSDYDFKASRSCLTQVLKRKNLLLAILKTPVSQNHVHIL